MCVTKKCSQMRNKLSMECIIPVWVFVIFEIILGYVWITQFYTSNDKYRIWYEERTLK